MTSDTAISAHDITVKFGSTIALDGLDLVAPAGGITALLGPNGAGKTTFVRAVATLQPYETGTLTVGGYDVASHPPQVRASIGLAGQHAAVVPELTGWQNLQLVGRLYGLSPSAAREAAHEVAEVFELADFAGRRVSSYSGGQRRRLDLAATFVGRPAVVLLDEPTTGLDPESRIRLWRVIDELPASGTSVLLTTQYLDEAQALADQVVIIDHGRVIREGSVDQLRRQQATNTLVLATDDAISGPTAQRIAARLEAMSVRHEGDRLVLVGRFDLDRAHRAVTDEGLPAALISEFALQPPSLQEIFLALTGERAGRHAS